MRWLAWLAIAACSTPPAPRATIATPPPPPPPLAADAAIGTADPIALVAMAGDGHWLVVCQARADTDGRDGIGVSWTLDDLLGDRFAPYLVRERGPGEPIDTYLGASPDGRWIGVVRGGKAFAVDTVEPRSVELAGADLADDGSEAGPTRAVALGRHHVVYLRADAIVIRDLRDGAERLAHAPGLVANIEIDAGDRWAKLSTIRRDSDGDGRLTPRRISGAPFERVWRCLPWLGKRVEHGDQVATSWLDLATGAIVDDPTIVTPVGGALLRIDDRERLTLDGALLAWDCRWGVYAVTHEPPRVLAGCGFGRGETDAPLSIFGPGRVRRTTSLVFRAPLFSAHGGHSPAVPFAVTDRHVCLDNRCLDLVTGRDQLLRGEVWHQFGDAVLLQRPVRGGEIEWAVANLATGAERVLAGETTPAIQPDGVLVRIGGATDPGDPVYDLRTARPVSLDPGTKIYGHDLEHRRYLVGGDDAGTDLALGPLRWRAVDR